MTSTPASTPATASSSPSSAYTVFGALSGLTAVGVLLQGLFAGIFLQQDGQRDPHWIDIHATGAHVTTVLAFLTLAWAVWRLRPRRDLWVGSLVLFLAVFFESYIGGLIRDDHKIALTIVHVPLAMVLLVVVAWLPLRARAGRR